MRKRLLAIVLLWFWMLGRSAAQENLADCRTFLVYDQENAYGSSYYHNKLKDFFSQDTSETYEKARSSAVKFGIDLGGLPTTFDGKDKQRNYRAYREAIVKSTYQEIVQKSEWSRAFVGLGAASANLVARCIEYLAARDTLYATIQPSIADGHFILSVRFPNGSTTSRKAPRFIPATAVSECTNLEELAAGTLLPNQGVDVSCKWDKTKSVEVLLSFAAGNRGVQLAAVPPPLPDLPKFSRFQAFELIEPRPPDCSNATFSLRDQGDGSVFSVVLRNAEQFDTCKRINFSAPARDLAEQVARYTGLLGESRFAFLSAVGGCESRLFRIIDKTKGRHIERNIDNNCQSLHFSAGPAALAEQAAKYLGLD